LHPLWHGDDIVNGHLLFYRRSYHSERASQFL
jgi:hypothetical protein